MADDQPTLTARAGVPARWWAASALLWSELFLAAIVSSGSLRRGCTGAGGERDDVCPDDPGAITSYLPWLALAVAAAALVTGLLARRRFTNAVGIGFVVNVVVFVVGVSVAAGTAVVE